MGNAETQRFREGKGFLSDGLRCFLKVSRDVPGILCSYCYCPALACLAALSALRVMFTLFILLNPGTQEKRLLGDGLQGNIALHIHNGSELVTGLYLDRAIRCPANKIRG